MDDSMSSPTMVNADYSELESRIITVMKGHAVGPSVHIMAGFTPTGRLSKTEAEMQWLKGPRRSAQMPQSYQMGEMVLVNGQEMVIRSLRTLLDDDLRERKARRDRQLGKSIMMQEAMKEVMYTPSANRKEVPNPRRTVSASEKSRSKKLKQLTKQSKKRNRHG